MKLSRPLDFLVVADHSDNMGFFPDLFAGKPEMLADPTGRRWYDMVQAGGKEGVKAALEIIDSFSRGTFPQALMFLPGSDRLPLDLGADHRRGGEVQRARPLHRLHRLRVDLAGAARQQPAPRRDLPRRRRQGDPDEPFTTYPPLGSTTPEDLWKRAAGLRGQDRRPGARHRAQRQSLQRHDVPDGDESRHRPAAVGEYAETRARWEPLYEVTQIKGDGEAHPFLSPNDEFAGYELWDKGNLNLSEAKKPEMLQGEYARTALQIGLQLEQKLGVNPYKFGMIGSTDTHTSLATAEEDNFFGKHSGAEPSPRSRDARVHAQRRRVPAWAGSMVASGYAGVWATENTREALWDAMMRKETYATTGPRMIVRFFGGWDFTEADAQTRSPADVGYGKGVPMGGDLRAAPAGKAPTFLVAALKDPIGGNLDRIQIVKGWVDADGARQEKVYDVVWSGDRKPGADGKLPPVGNTVDVAEGDLDQHDRRLRADRGLDGPGLRSRAARLLLRPRDRDPDAALDRLRRQALRRQDAAGGADVDAGARLHVADLVHAGLTEATMKLLREPLLHFLVLGAALFGLFHCWPTGDEARPTRSSSRAGQIDSLAGDLRRTWQRPPTAEETEGLVDEYIRDEVFYREARRDGPRARRRGRPPPPAAEDGVRRGRDAPTPSRRTPS